MKLLPPLTTPLTVPAAIAQKISDNLHKLNTDDTRKVKPHPAGRPASRSLQDVFDFFFYPGWTGLGSNTPPSDIWGRPQQVVGHDSIGRPIFKDLPPPRGKTLSGGAPARVGPPKPGDAGYVNPKLQAETDATVKAIGVHDPPPPFRLPPAPGQASADPYAVVHRLLAIQQAKAMHYGKFHAWTTTAMKYGVPTPELIAAALATRTTAEPWAIEALAKKIQRGVGPGGNLQAFLWNEYPDADAGAIRSIYKAANAENYVPEYRTASH